MQVADTTHFRDRQLGFHSFWCLQLGTYLKLEFKDLLQFPSVESELSQKDETSYYILNNEKLCNIFCDQHSQQSAKKKWNIALDDETSKERRAGTVCSVTSQACVLRCRELQLLKEFTGLQPTWPEL